MRIQVSPKHPHGPCEAEVIEDKVVIGQRAFRCKHIRPHSCMDGLCEMEFFVFAKDIISTSGERHGS